MVGKRNNEDNQREIHHKETMTVDKKTRGKQTPDDTGESKDRTATKTFPKPGITGDEGAEPEI